MRSLVFGTEAQSTPLAATVWFVAGYFLVWVAFALLATLVQWTLERTALLDSAMASTSNILGGLVCVAAGSYQWTRLKDVCPTQCQTPFAFLMRHGGFRRDVPGCLLLGFRHGAYCVGCCWALMVLLFVGGVMNLLWIVLLSLLIFLEQVTFLGRKIAPLAGIFLVAAVHGCCQWECLDGMDARAALPPTHFPRTSWRVRALHCRCASRSPNPPANKVVLLRRGYLA
jgi:predicted metal-binding membrane protein